MMKQSIDLHTFGPNSDGTIRDPSSSSHQFDRGNAACSLTGMRQLVVNGVLWSVGIEVPTNGANCEIALTDLQSMQTARTPKPAAKK